MDSFPFEPPGKPKNTVVGRLSFLQGIFPIQELNRGLLHCRWFLYQLSYQGSLQNDWHSESTQVDSQRPKPCLPGTDQSVYSLTGNKGRFLTLALLEGRYPLWGEDI